MGAVVTVQECWSGVNGSSEALAGPYQSRFTAARRFTVTWSDMTATAPDIYTAAGVPALRAQFPGYTYLYCQRKRVTPIAPNLWEVICEYGGVNSVLATPYKRRWSSARSTIDVTTDANGLPMKRPSGRPIILPKERSDRVYSVTRNEAALCNFETYDDSINADVFLGWAAGKARLTDIQAEDIWEENTYYWRVTYEFQFRNDGWKTKALLEDTVVKDPDTGAWVPMMRSVRVDANGYQLADGAADVVNSYAMFRSVNYAPLAIT